MDHFRKVFELVFIETDECGTAYFWSEHDFERPDRPERDKSDPFVGFDNNAFLMPKFFANDFGEHRLSGFVEIGTLRLIFLGDNRRNVVRCPDLTVRMRIAAAHYCTFIFEDLDPVVKRAEFFSLGFP